MKMLENKKRFKTEDKEREFWSTHSPLDFFDTANAKKAFFPNLRPSLRSISIRLPEDIGKQKGCSLSEPGQNVSCLGYSCGTQGNPEEMKVRTATGSFTRYR